VVINRHPLPLPAALNGKIAAYLAALTAAVPNYLLNTDGTSMNNAIPLYSIGAIIGAAIEVAFLRRNALSSH
jgi:hypothetical protein